MRKQVWPQMNTGHPGVTEALDMRLIGPPCGAILDFIARSLPRRINHPQSPITKNSQPAWLPGVVCWLDQQDDGASGIGGAVFTQAFSCFKLPIP